VPAAQRSPGLEGLGVRRAEPQQNRTEIQPRRRLVSLQVLAALKKNAKSF